MPATIVDRYGRLVVPDGGRMSVPLPFRDALSAGALVRPGRSGRSEPRPARHGS